ncbi:MAG TPA: hypothetical protein VLJ11_17720 [Bryobacteraceae bacterium]|nr:hypothetical protein [Bryobacteraceae bacterium]
MDSTNVELLHEEWQKLVQEREGVLQDVHKRKISFTEWNKRERMYAARVNEAFARLKHAQAREFCREMVGQFGN